MNRATPTVRRAIGATLLATALLGCSKGDDDASDTTAAESAADDSTTTSAGDDETTTTEAPAGSGSGDDSCPTDASEVSDAIGATVQDGDPGQADLLISSADVRERADALCMFSADGGFTQPFVVILTSDDPEAESAARSILEGNDAEPVAGVGDQAFGSGGELIFQSGDTWSAVLATVGSDPTADQAAAIAVAHLIGG